MPQPVAELVTAGLVGTARARLAVQLHQSNIADRSTRRSDLLCPRGVREGPKHFIS